MDSAPKSPEAATPKGRNVGVWLSGETILALNKAVVTPVGRFKEGTYCADAVVQRLQREGFLKNGAESEVAAQAFELSRSLGSDLVKAALVDLAAKHAEVAGS